MKKQAYIAQTLPLILFHTPSLCIQLRFHISASIHPPHHVLVVAGVFRLGGW